MRLYSKNGGENFFTIEIFCNADVFYLKFKIFVFFIVIVKFFSRQKLEDLKKVDAALKAHRVI